MGRMAVFCLVALNMGCATLQHQSGGVLDTPRNLRGDVSRGFVDVLETRVAEQGSNLVFEVNVAAPFPEASAMGGKRVDYIWLVDIDCDPKTGQSELGNDYNIHLWLDETGWHPEFFKVSPVAQQDAATVDPAKFGIEVEGARARLSFPREYLPGRAFDWRLHAMTDNAPAWKPSTENPMTPVTRFGEEDLSQAVSPHKTTHCAR